MPVHEYGARPLTAREIDTLVRDLSTLVAYELGEAFHTEIDVMAPRVRLALTRILEFVDRVVEHGMETRQTSLSWKPQGTADVDGAARVVDGDDRNRRANKPGSGE